MATNEVLTQLLANAKSELEYALHRLHRPSLKRYTVVRRSSSGIVTAMRLLETSPNTKFNFAATASTAANLRHLSDAETLRDLADELRSPTDVDGTYEVMDLMEYFEHRIAELRSMIKAVEENI